MRKHFFFLGITVLCLSSATAMAASCFFASDGMAMVGGKRTFIIGLYENPEEDAVLQRVANSGFNLVQSKPDSAALDRLHQHDLWAWINTGMAINLSHDIENRKEQLTKLADDYAAHPALLVWEVPDEALWNCWHRAMQWRSSGEWEALKALAKEKGDETLQKLLPLEQQAVRQLRNAGKYAEAEARADALWEKLGTRSPRVGEGLADAALRVKKMGAGMLQGYRYLQKLDQAHPVWMNHAPRNQLEQLTYFGRAADIVGCDIYPVPPCRFVRHSDLQDQMLSSVGAYTQRMQASVPGKPVWMVLQAFGWGDIQPDRSEEIREILRRPSLSETRFMAFDAIVHGARGLLYWGTMAIEKDSPLFDELLAFSRELAQYQPVLAAPDADINYTWHIEESYGSLEKTIAVLPKQLQDNVWWIVVNESQEPLTYTLQGLEAYEGTVYKDAYSDDSAKVQKGTLKLTLPPEKVHLLHP